MPTRLVVLAADASLAGVAMVWGATFPLGKLVLRHLGPFQYLALRFAAAAALMVPLAWRERGRLRPAGVRAGVLAGVLLFAGAALQTVGLQYTTAGNAGLITGLNVLIIPLILLVWQRRLPTGALAAGVGLAAAGLWLLLWQGERIGGAIRWCSGARLRWRSRPSWSAGSRRRCRRLPSRACRLRSSRSSPPGRGSGSNPGPRPCPRGRSPRSSSWR